LTTANTLAYLAAASATKKKRFITSATDHDSTSCLLHSGKLQEKNIYKNWFGVYKTSYDLLMIFL